MHDLSVFFNSDIGVASNVLVESLQLFSGGDSSGNGDLLVFSGKGSLGLGNSGGLLNSLSGERIELSVLCLVSQWVLSLALVHSDVLFGGSKNSLDFIRVDKSGNIGVGENFLGEFVATFEWGGLTE